MGWISLRAKVASIKRLIEERGRLKRPGVSIFRVGHDALKSERCYWIFYSVVKGCIHVSFNLVSIIYQGDIDDGNIISLRRKRRCERERHREISPNDTRRKGWYAATHLFTFVSRPLFVSYVSLKWHKLQTQRELHSSLRESSNIKLQREIVCFQRYMVTKERATLWTLVSSRLTASIAWNSLFVHSTNYCKFEMKFSWNEV